MRECSAAAAVQNDYRNRLRLLSRTHDRGSEKPIRLIISDRPTTDDDRCTDAINGSPCERMIAARATGDESRKYYKRSLRRVVARNTSVVRR